MYCRCTALIAHCLAVMCASGIATCVADSYTPKPLTISKQYWQVLPQVSWVFVDHAGNPWYARRGGDIAATCDDPPYTIAPQSKMLLGDRSGRIWVKHKYRNDPARFYDGRKWHETNIHAHLAVEDEAGRVFLIDRSTVHALDKGQWIAQRMIEEDKGGAIRFTHDDSGRVWFWAKKQSYGHWGTDFASRGIWVFRREAWQNYRTDAGLRTNDVESVHSLGKARLLIVHADPKKSPNYSVWMPEGKLIKAEAALFPEKEAPSHVHYIATDQKGLRHFSAEGGKALRFTIAGDGRPKWLAQHQTHSLIRPLKGIYENSNKFYSTPGQLAPPCPVNPGEVICQDRHGRIYFRHRPGVGVLWPKHEKRGDILWTKRDAYVGRIFQDSAGTIWGQPRNGKSALVRFSGNTWQETPVKIKPHPYWMNRGAVPWYVWQRHGPVLLPGEKGALLAVVVRDVYQDVAAELMQGEPIQSGKINELSQKHLAKRGRSHWLEAWYLRDGKWIGPEPVQELLRRHRPSLTKGFTASAKQTTPFSLQSDGRNLWACHGGHVYAYPGDKIFKWRLPNPLEFGLAQSSLCQLPDGRMLCCSLIDKQSKSQLHALRVTDKGIEAEVFPLPVELSSPVEYPYVTAGGDLWLWAGDQVFQFTGEKWTLRKDLKEPLFEELDGSLWFMPGEGYDSRDEHRGYRIVKGNATHTFPWPAEYTFGWLRPSPSGEVHAACGYWQVTLSAADDPLKRRIKTARILQHYNSAAALQLADGKFLLTGGYVGTITKPDNRAPADR